VNFYERLGHARMRSATVDAIVGVAKTALFFACAGALAWACAGMR
jgi:hypothetical protein